MTTPKLEAEYKRLYPSPHITTETNPEGIYLPVPEVDKALHLNKDILLIIVGLSAFWGFFAWGVIHAW